jgi:hypothetical protein
MKLTDGASDWLHNTALFEVENESIQQFNAAIRGLAASGIPLDLISAVEDGATEYAVSMIEAAFLVGIEVGKDPIGYLVMGKPLVRQQAAVEVRCKCGKGWTMLQIPDKPDLGETWPCFRWLDKMTGREMDRCVSCGEPTSAVSTAPF